MVAAESRASCSGLQELPDDVLALLSAILSPRDVVMLGATCRKLRGACVADKLWLPHCERILTGVDLYSWRDAVNSFQSLWRFARSVCSLVGLWVHQNPELGNLVNVTWGFLSVVGCRIIPQELGPHGLESGMLWAPVFEIIGNADGSLAFFLHGKENEREELCYPGRFLLSDPNPNVLLLEVEPLLQPGSSTEKGSYVESALVHAERNSEEWVAGLPRRSAKPSGKASVASITTSSSTGKGKKKMFSELMPFHRLGFGDRRRLLELLAPQIALQVPSLASGSLFPCSRRSEWMDVNKVSCSSELYRSELTALATRRAHLIRVLNGGRENESMNSGPPRNGRHSRSSVSPSGSQHSKFCSENEWLLKALSAITLSHDSSRASGKPKAVLATATTAGARTQGNAPLRNKKQVGSDHGSSAMEIGANKFGNAKREGLARFVVSKMKQMMGMRRSDSVGKIKTSSSSMEAKRILLHDFLKQSKSVGLRLHATNWNLNFYRAWPIMHNNQFALYKIPEHRPSEGMDYAGIWGGTFGWPLEPPTAQEKPGKALFFVKISYEETNEGRVLIATKILEGTQYVRHPNGSAMFTAKVDESSSAIFPWEKDKGGHSVDIRHCFPGEGIAHGYGFRYPGSKPGDLFVDNAGFLSFVWRESRAALTLRRLDLQALLENGKRVPVLPPVANFAYLTKSYSNVFAGTGAHTAAATGTTPGLRSSALSAAISGQ